MRCQATRCKYREGANSQHARHAFSVCHICRLHAYIHDYLRKKGFRAAAEQFKIESKLPDVPGGEHPGGVRTRVPGCATDG